MKVFLDDYRDPYVGWTLVRTTNEAIGLLETGGVEAISLDHDLGHFDTKSGYDVACWIEEKAFTEDFQPPRMYCHSWNPVGKEKILTVFSRIEKHIKEKQLDGQANNKSK